MRFVLGTLISILVASCGLAHAGLSDTVNTIPQPGARFTAQNQEFDRDEDSDRFHETACRQETFVYSGCLGATAASLSHTPSSCTAYARGYRLTETGSITYQNNATCWVIYDRNVTGDLVSSITWTRVLGTHYLRYCGAASPTPTLPDGTGFLMAVTTSAGAITAVTDLRNFGACGEGGSSFVCADLVSQSCDLCPLITSCCTGHSGDACTQSADCCEGACVNGTCTLPDGLPCITIKNLTSAHDNVEFFIAPAAATVTKVTCHCVGTCTPTLGTFTFHDRNGNAVSLASTLTCSTGTSNSTWVATTSGNGLVTGEGLEFDTTNSPTPGDSYTLCAQVSVP